MTWIITEDRVVAQPIATASDTQNHALGTIVKAKDSTYGFGEFIYLKGVSSNFTGALVTYVTSTGVTALSTTAGVLTGGAPMAVSMSAATGSQYGWFQIAGDAIMYKTAVKFDPATNQHVYLSGTAGRIMQTSVAGRQIIGARFAATTTVTSTTSTAIVTLNRPSQKSGSAV
jgi:hypothetical protein